MSAKPSDSGSSPSRGELRRSPRIDVRNRLSGRIVAFDLPVVVRDISLGGFSIESDRDFPDGAHDIRLHEGERWSVTVNAASRHRQVIKAQDGAMRYIMGFEYNDQNPDTQQILRVLFERLAADRPAE
jgi:hypothetical protein